MTQKNYTKIYTEKHDKIGYGGYCPSLNYSFSCKLSKKLDISSAENSDCRMQILWFNKIPYSHRSITIIRMRADHCLRPNSRKNSGVENVITG